MTATTVEFHRVLRKISSPSVSRYQRSENPVNGNDTAPLAWNEKSTTMRERQVEEDQRDDGHRERERTALALAHETKRIRSRRMSRRASATSR